MIHDPRFQRESGREVLTAGELLVKGALETVGGIHLLAAVGSARSVGPVADLARRLDAGAPSLASVGVVARTSPSPRAALAIAAGAQGVGRRALLVLDADAFIDAAADVAALLDAPLIDESALVIVIAQPAAASGRDARALVAQLDLPLIEPGNPQRIKDAVPLAVQMSVAARSPVAIWLPASLASGGGSVELRANHVTAPASPGTPAGAAASPASGAPPARLTLADDRDLRRRAARRSPAPQPLDPHAVALAEARRHQLNRFDRRPQRGERVPLGFVVAGSVAPALDEALETFDLVGRFPILTLGLVHPIDDQPIGQMLAQCHRVIVIEPGAPAIEREAAAIAESMRHGDATGPGIGSVWGRRLPFDRPGLPADPLETATIVDRLGRLMLDHAGVVGALQPIERNAIRAAVGRAEQTDAAPARLPARTPTFAPGSSHRDVAGVLDDLRRDLLDTQYMRRRHKSAAVALLIHAERDAAALLDQPPHESLVHVVDADATGPAAAAGVDPFIANRQVVVTTDAALERAGHAALVDAVLAAGDVTFIVLSSREPARSTDGLPLAPPDPVDAAGPARVERIVRAITPRKRERRPAVLRINPAEREALRSAIEESVTRPGVAVIIADPFIDSRPSRAAMWQRAQAAEHGYAPQATFDHIDPDVCEHCLECSARIGCPSLAVVATDRGPKLAIDRAISVNDGAASRVDACPAFEQVTVLRTREPHTRDARIGRIPLGEIPRPIHAKLAVWRCCIAGVGGDDVSGGSGGTDIELAQRVLVAAGREMGYHVRFSAESAPAGFGAPWVGRIAFTRDAHRSVTDSIGVGGADLLLGGDALEVARAVDSPIGPIASPARTAAVVNDTPAPTMAQLAGRDPADRATVNAVLDRAVADDHRLRFPIADACQRLLGDKRLMPLALVGAAYQRGYLPVTLEAVESAIGRLTSGHTDARRAFDLGRRIATSPDRVRRLFEPRPESPQRTLRRRAAVLRAAHRGRRGRRLARRFAALLEPTLATLAEHRVDPSIQRDAVIGAYDCAVWGGLSVARKYCRRVLEIMRKDDPARAFAATRAVVWNLARAVVVKDEFYVAALLTSPEKRLRDRRAFRVYPARGDRIVYRRDHRPEPILLGRGFRFQWRSRAWHLRLLARYRWLRHLLPGHAKREHVFRDWYKRLVDRATWTTDAEYDRWVTALRAPEQVTGFREVRYPKMDRARADAEALLAETPAEEAGASPDRSRPASPTESRVKP